MSECRDLSTKYLRGYEAGVEIIIDRVGVLFHMKLPYRKNGGMDKTWIKARKIRDEKHIELFGCPISKRFTHVKKKSGKDANYDLPPGISHGYSRGTLLYMVVSYCEEPNIPKRKRFNIKKLGYDEALRLAIEFKKNLPIN